MTLMAKKSSKRSDRHKPSTSVRIPQRLIPLLEQVKERRCTKSITDEVVRAVREMLEREGLWPPGGACENKE